MVGIRPFGWADLSFLVTGACEVAWESLAPEQRLQVSPADVAGRTAALLRQALVQSGAIVLVAEVADRPVGFEFLLLQHGEVSGLPEATKWLSWVAPAFRGRGLNLMLHQAGEVCCRARGVRRMVAVVGTENRASLRATAKAGFGTEKVIRTKWLADEGMVE